MNQFKPALQLEMPPVSASRFVVGIISLLVYIGCFFGLWVVCGAFGLVGGLLIAGLPIVSAGAGIWWLGRDSFQSRAPVFTG